MLPEQPETTVLVNTTNKTVKKQLTKNSKKVYEIQPGEGKIPTNYLRDEDFDISAFPQHFPKGRYGLFEERKPKVNPQSFFTQRLLNHDKRFSKDPNFIFIAQQYVERHNLERQIDISYQKGIASKTSVGTKMIQTKDAFSVFQKIPGTPAYWKLFRNEILAKIEQLGNFQFFFTLSCAEKKWPEVWLLSSKQVVTLLNLLTQSGMGLKKQFSLIIFLCLSSKTATLKMHFNCTKTT